jgi:hypothetical protein
MGIKIKGQIYSPEYGFHNQLAKLIKLEKIMANTLMRFGISNTRRRALPLSLT